MKFDKAAYAKEVRKALKRRGQKVTKREAKMVAGLAAWIEMAPQQEIM